MREPDRGVLDNGLEVLSLTTDAPVTAVHLWLDAGAADEPDAHAGVAHFLEHMVFKGTARRGVGQTARDIEALGGDLNAYTTYDHTVLHTHVDPACWEDAVEVLADMVTTPRIDPAEVERERAVIREEMAGYEADPESLADDLLQPLLFGDHAYGRPVLGDAARLAAIDADALRAFHDRAWSPRRAWLAIVGPVDAQAARAVAARHLGAWTGVGPRAPSLAAGSGRPGLLVQGRPHLETTALTVGWRTPALGHPDLPALELVAAVLGQGESALLPVRLQREAQAAAGVWADLSARRAGGALVAGWLPQDEATAEGLAAALEEVRALGATGPTGRLLSQIRDLLIADQLFADETVEGLASDLLWYHIRRGGWEARRIHRAARAAVGAMEVRDATRRWLTPEQTSVVAVGPGANDSALREVLYPKRPRPRPTLPVAGETTLHTLPGGTRLLLAPDARPTAAARVFGLGGGLLEQPRTAGAAQAWARLVTEGAGPLDDLAFAEEADGLGAVVEATASRSGQAISATFPAWNTQGALQLLVDAWTAPRFDAEAWTRVQGELIEEVETLPDEPEALAWQEVWAGLFPGHPWRLPDGGTVASLEAITRDRIQKVHTQWARPDQLTLAVVGGFDPDAVLSDLHDWLSEGKSRRDAPLAARPTPGPAEQGRRELRAGHGQAHVLAAFRSPATHAPDRIAFDVAATLLDAQGGRLFLALREERALAYAVWADALDGTDGGVFAAGLSTTPDRADEAEAALREALARFADEGPTEAELQRAQRMILGQLAAALQRAGARAADLATADRFGLAPGVAGVRALLTPLRPAQVRDAFAAAWAQQPLVVVTRPHP
jgi:zinc protease